MQSKLQKFIPPQLVRGVFIIITGVELTAIMCNWQITDVYLWDFTIINKTFTNVGSHILFCALYMTGFIAIIRFGPAEFVGLKQLGQSVEEIGRTEGMPELVTNGLFGLVRHPLYYFSILSLMLSPSMSLDAAILGLTLLLYFVFAIPIEERKLVKIFGKAYEEYQKTTPMLFASPFRIFTIKNRVNGKTE
jgi:protein-S-isoprenylcysteine O-methyltransferase Ste14